MRYHGLVHRLANELTGGLLKAQLDFTILGALG